MSDPVSHILSLGRALPPEDRERLVEQLMESLNEPAAAELDTAWETRSNAGWPSSSGVKSCRLTQKMCSPRLTE